MLPKEPKTGYENKENTEIAIPKEGCGLKEVTKGIGYLGLKRKADDAWVSGELKTRKANTEIPAPLFA